jgi:cell division protein FtsB
MRRPTRLPLVLLGSLTLAAYFGYHSINGKHGLQARNQLMERASMLERDIGRLEAVRAKLQRDAALLAPEQPDPDMVTWIAADVLGYVAADAIVIVPAK